MASISTALIADVASSTPDLAATSTAAASSSPDVMASATSVATSAPSTSTTAIESPPKGLAKVHIIGTKYTDYFTDGTTVTAFPGDPAIDSNFDKPNAPIPTHEGLTWDHTSGGYLYDTPSGDLEVGDYAVQPDGSYVENAALFVSSTSTAPILGVSATSSIASSSPASSVSLRATSTVPASPDTSSTSTETTTPSVTTTVSIIPSGTSTSSESNTPTL